LVGGRGGRGVERGGNPSRKVAMSRFEELLKIFQKIKVAKGGNNGKRIKRGSGERPRKRPKSQNNPTNQSGGKEKGILDLLLLGQKKKLRGGREDQSDGKKKVAKEENRCTRELGKGRRCPPTC